MKKILFFCLVVLLSVSFVNASEDIKVDIISSTDNSVTLKVKSPENNSICFLYRSNDMVDYSEQKMIDCNKMYVDKGLVAGETYYYKATVGNNENYSNVEVISLDASEEMIYNLTRDVSNFSNIGMIFVFGFGTLMIVFVLAMMTMKKRMGS